MGAGTGARAGGLKGGVGTASAVLPDGTTVGALVVANAQGADKGRIYGQLLAYAAIIVLGAPLLTWALLVPTGII